MGELRRVTPIERAFGFGRGQPVDRHYIEQFLESNALAIERQVLEIGDATYTRRFGGERVSGSDVLNVTPTAEATIVADLADADRIPSNAFDCIICTQTLQLIYDLPAAVRTLFRILKPGGVLLATVPGISQTDDRTWEGTWYWSFTPLAVNRLFADAFGPAYVEVEAHGNVLTSVAFLHGLGADELTDRERSFHDPSYPFLITAKAIKPLGGTEAPDRDLVSVVIACRDHGLFLDQAIESALGQADGGIEVIVVDDGSTDNTCAVATRYPEVRYIYQPHQGLPAARNTGLAASSGTCLVFLDADDRLMPHAVAIGRRSLRARRDCAFVSGGHRLIDVDGEVLHECRSPVTGRDHFAEMLKGNYISMGAAVLYRREAVVAVGGFDPELPACEDYDLYLRITRRFPVCTHDEVIAEYRRHGQAMTDDTARMLRAVVRVLESQRRFIGDDPVRQRALNEGLRGWREYYGSRCADVVAKNLGAPRRRIGALADGLTLARCAPTQFRRMVRHLLAR
jgi:SAM-dependent methyltransferase